MGVWPPPVRDETRADDAHGSKFVRITTASSPEAKIALFRSLFRGRTDVYPLRFESRKTGKAGYQPACGNEWIAGLCEKPRIKCFDCPNRRFLPVTDEVIGWHLSGHNNRGQKFVAGVYPMLQDETCWFLAADFDGSHWQHDVTAVIEACRQIGLPTVLERSRSGNGAHLWFFFAETIPAAIARRLGAHVLTETMERRPEIGFRSYDRLFPNQDTLPKGGFGNLIALPLQKELRSSGNTVFVDERFEPYADQWAFLASVPRISREQIETIATAAELNGRIVGLPHVPSNDSREDAFGKVAIRRHEKTPTIIGILPDQVDLILADGLIIRSARMPPALRNRLLHLAAFENPEFYRAQSMRLPTYDKPRIIHCGENHPDYIALPRGCFDEARKLLSRLKIRVRVVDERAAGPPVAMTFCGTLRPDQQRAADAMVAHDIGVLSATTAFGKTVVASWLIAQRGVTTLVLVHRKQLLDQWIERLSSFLGVAANTIGCLGSGRKKLSGALDVALMQSVVRKGAVDRRVADYGHVVFDECHHLSAYSFELVARRARARFVTGLSATVTRKDGHHPIIFMQCGPVRYRVDAKRQAAERPFAHRVFVRPTSFAGIATPEQNPTLEFHRLAEALTQDEARNESICADAVSAVREGRAPLILTERREHLESMAEQLSAHAVHVVTLRGGMGRREFAAAQASLARLPEPTGRIILATGAFIGEGFDDARLDTLLLTFPVSWRGTIAQYAGRLHRLHQGKREVRIYDYADLNVPMLARMFDRRCRGYEELGYTVVAPASALPGWPSEVPLPIDPEWKRGYAATVRRLVRDGVDANLARAFVHAARPFSPDAVGVMRARSASEAFLFSRFESLSGTAGRFALNVQLPIPFDSSGQMEVDFFCADARLVIELDGAQHLADSDAYRSDRRKDALLQQNGYFVLRFLAEDAGKQLDHILDTVLATLAHRTMRR